MIEKQNALGYLFRELKKAKIALSHAQETGTREETEALEKKIRAIDYLIPIVIRQDEGEKTYD